MKLPAVRLPLPLLLLALVLACPPAMQPTAEADGDADKAAMSTLLVKLPAEHVQDLVSWAHEKGGRIVDTETMTRLVPVGTPQPKPTPIVKRKTLPVLASARLMLAAADAAMSEARGKQAEHTLVLESVAITGQRMRLKILAQNAETVDAVRVALASNASLVARAKRGARGIEMGALKRTKDGMYSVDFNVRFASPYVGERPIRPDEPEEGMLLVQKAAAPANMTQMYASSRRVDQIRKEGLALAYRDYQFQAADLKRLGALLHNLERGTMTVTELAYTRAHAKDQKPGEPARIGTTRLRLAILRALAE